MVPPTKTIVAAIVADEFDTLVLDHALASAYDDRPVDLHVVTVLGKATDAELEACEKRLKDSLLKEASLIAESLGSEAKPFTPRVWVHGRVGKAAREIAMLAEDVRADEILIGAPLKRQSVVPMVVQLAPCSVRVVRATEYQTANAGCPDCIEARRLSDGDKWFCAEHSGSKIPRLVSRIPTSYLSRPTQFG